MKFSLGHVLAGAICASLAACQVQAAATLVDDLRELNGTVDLNFGFNEFEQVLTPTSPGDPFDATIDSGNITDINPVAEGSVFATQTSSFDALPFSNVMASGSATSTAEATGPQAFAESDADSLFRIEFSIATAMAYLLTGTIDDGPSGSTGRVRLRPKDGANIFSATTDGPFSDSGTLLPGNYELFGEALTVAFADEFTGPLFSTRSAEFELDFTITPEPGTGMLILCAGVALARRRRPAA